MLPRKRRLRKKKDFISVLENSKRFQGKFLTLTVNGDNVEDMKFGVIVSNKVSKKAVVRNKIKRILRDVARKKLIDQKGLFLIRAKKEAAGIDTSSLRMDANSLINKALKIIKNE